MTGLRFAVVLCVFLIQRAASQCNCQSELYISIDDLINALNNGPGIPGLINQNQGCGCQQSQQSGGNQQSCGCNQQSQPTITINSLPSNQCGCNQISQPQPTITINSLPSNQCGCQQSQPQPTIAINSLPSNQCGCNRPSIKQQCGCQQISPSQSCGCNQNSQAISISSLPSFGQACQPITVSSPPVTLNLQSNSNQCGCQSTQCSCNQPSQSRQITYQVPSGNQVCQSGNQVCQSGNQVSENYESVSITPAALLQAPPYGIYFAGDNLIIDGAVQVCGNLPFNSVIEIGGVVPTSGSGCVQYVCGDTCA